MDNQTSPIVSVVITTYGCPTNIERAVKSVLAQTYTNIELIVVDDNGLGTDNQKRVSAILTPYIETEKLHYYPHDVNKNGSAARNTGIKASKGKYIAFLDDDDEFVPEKISMQLKAMDSISSEWGGCYCVSRIWDSPDHSFVTIDKDSGDLRNELLTNKLQCNTSTFFIRKDVLDEMNGFDVSFRRHQDWEFLMRFFRKWKLKLLDEVLVVRHREDGEFGPRGDKYFEIRHKFLKTFIDDINTLSEKDEILFLFYWDLSINKIRMQKFREGLELRKKACKYRPMTKEESKLWSMVFIRNCIKWICPLLIKKQKRKFNV